MPKTNFERYTLQNGIDALLIPRPESLATTVMATVKVGSKYETKDTSGLSHFLEHMTFKGTKQRPKAADIAETLDALGASYNAFTGQEQTAYFAKVRNESFNKALDIIADLYLNPTVPVKELEKERGVIIEEINMIEDIPMQGVQYDFLKVLYGDQPAGWPIMGRKEVIKKLERDDFIKYRRKHYASENTILAIAGGYSEKEIKEKLERAFGSLERQPETALPDVVEKQKVPAELVRFKKLDQAHLIIGFRAFDVHDKRRFALGTLTSVLGSGMSSRLYKKIRHEMGAAYYIHADADLDTNSGIIAVSAGASINKIREVIQAILDEFKQLTEKPVGEKELAKVKEHMIGNLFLALETSDNLAMFYSGQRVRGLDPLTAEEIAEKITAITAEEILDVARDIFVNDGLNLAVVGPFENDSFSDILKV